MNIINVNVKMFNDNLYLCMITIDILIDVCLK